MENYDALVFIERDTEFGCLDDTAIIICKDEDSFEKQVKEHLEDNYDLYVDDENTLSQEEYVSKIFNKIKRYEETYDPIMPSIKYKLEYHHIF